MRRVAERLLDSPRTPALAAAITLVLGLFFVFVWTPLPWGWRGIDFYNDLALALARGEPFQTTDVPWGYAYFIAACYAAFGPVPWVPMALQALANAAAPLLLYRLVRPLTTQRTAAMAALLTGVFSFNTVYASTQASDSLCTVLFLATLLCFAQGHRQRSLWAMAVSGLLAGIVPQFRPNMILLPAVMAGLYLVWRPHSWRKVAQMAVFAACMALALTPWVVRNYRLTGLVMPTSTHGGEQLWYGTLQVGPYLENRAHNPRSVFESAAFDYTSVTEMPIVVSADLLTCEGRAVAAPALVFRTNHHTTERRVSSHARSGETTLFEIPTQADGTTLYYYFEAVLLAADGQTSVPVTVPVEGATNPLISFVSTNHVGDLDRHGDLIDVFDIVRVVRHLAWGEPLANAGRLDFDHDGEVDRQDLEKAIAVLLPDAHRIAGGPAFRRLETGADAAVLVLGDGALRVPKAFAWRQTDLAASGGLAEALVTRWQAFDRVVPTPGTCLFVENIGVNRVFYRHEPHMLRRYTALALDNIQRDPIGFAAASAYRMIRMFIIRGSDDPATTQQFRWSRLVYGAGQWISTLYFLVFVGGVAVAWRQRSALLVFVVPIVYIPLTICFVLTNMRYTVTVQPLMFAFVAVALAAALRIDSKG